jgi:hypothetical protein
MRNLLHIVLEEALINSLPFHTASKITWLNSKPIWVDQWALTGEKLAAAQALIQEQL